jgi:hypothetical protein
LAVLTSMELIVREDPLDELQGGAVALDKCGNLSKLKIKIVLPSQVMNVLMQGAWTSATHCRSNVRLR